MSTIPKNTRNSSKNKPKRIVKSTTINYKAKLNANLATIL